jgi:quercetin dioxygenase-like cupin family protein
MKQSAGLVLADGDGEALWFGSSLVVFKATSKQTNGAFMILELTAPRGNGTALHVHEREDETIFVLEGELDVFVDGIELRGGPGMTAVSRRGVPHAFRVASEKARLLFYFTPGIDSETFFREAGGPAANRRLPVDASLDLELAMAAGKRNHLKNIGPTPFAED